MISMVLIEVGIISTIIALSAVSDKHSGFMTLRNQPQFTIMLEQISPLVLPGFLYHSLPTLLMTIYGKLKEATVSAVWERQPFVELARGSNNPSSLEKTLLLDYSKDAWKREYKAYRNRHYTILACALIVNLNTVGMATLTSYLFTTAQIHINTAIPGIQSMSFNEDNANLGDARPALDTVTAIDIYGAPQPAWSTAEYVFAPFQVNDESANATAELVGYSGNLSCQTITSEEYVIQIENSSFTISAEDRFCNVSQSFDLPVPQGVSLWTYPYNSCSLESGPSRLLMFAWNSSSPGLNPPSNLSFISCRPTYWQTPGNLTVNFEPPTQGSIVSFVPGNATQMVFLPRLIYEQGLQGIQTYDALTNLWANDFGRLLYGVASIEDPSSPLGVDNLSTCITALYASIFAIFASGDLIVPLSPPQSIMLTAAVPVTRLLVVQPLAYALTVLLLINLLLTVLLLRYTGQTSILSEELEGPLGAAALLHGSEVMDIVGEAKCYAENPGNEFVRKVVSYVKEIYSVRKSQCYWADAETNGPRIKLDVREKESRLTLIMRLILVLFPIT
jgi:hypothetical protein